ncbi:MAG: magnesium/cobalt transporter CorA [Anaerolineales bacterium]|nr:magnesium/cobalt transporter CorA [Anaerolineales bacterium]
MFRALYFKSDGRLQTDLSIMDVAFALQDMGGLLWVDFEAMPHEQAEPVLQKTFGFHPLAIDDALRETHVPKVDDWGSYLYIVLHAVTYNPQAGERLDTQELDIFLGSNYLVTHHDFPIASLEQAWALVQRDERHLKRGCDYLLYRLVSAVMAGYMPVIKELDGVIDQVEGEVFGRPGPDLLERIFALKRAALHLRRIIRPQREMLNRLARDDFQVIDPRERVYFRDVYDHLARLYDITDNILDLARGALDTYLSVVNNRMNEIVKTLTIITTLFMPLTFIVGFFGMNFFLPARPISEWMGRPIFYVLLILFIALPITMYGWMRRRGWM